MNNNEVFEVGWTMVIIVIFFVIAIIIGGLMLAGVRPAFMSLEREANQQSQQYTESVQTRLYQLSRKYDDLQADIDRLSSDESNAATIIGMVARQESILDEIEEEAGRIPKSEVPQKIKTLLQQKGKW